MTTIRIDLLPDFSGSLSSALIPAMEGGVAGKISAEQIAQLAVSLVVDGSSEALDTLKELSAALNNDENFATNILSALDGKASLSGPIFTGGVVRIDLPSGLDLDDTISGASNTLEIRQPTAQKDALISFHVSGDHATYLGLDGGLNDFVIGGWSNGANKYRIWSEKNNSLVGAVQYFAMATAPDGWLKCNGAAISRTTYAALFARIGTTYGAGDGSTTFNLPDLRGEFIRGFDDGRGVDASRPLGSFQNHAANAYWQIFAYDYSWDGSGSRGNVTSNTADLAIGRLSASYSGVHRTQTTDSGGSVSWETRPRNLALLACIKY